MAQCNNENCPCKRPLLALAVPMQRAEDFAVEALRAELEGQRVGELEASPEILLDVLDYVEGNTDAIQRLAYAASSKIRERGDGVITDEEMRAILDYLMEENKEVLRRLK